MNIFLNFLFHLAAFFAGAWLVVMTILSALRTFVLPRSARDPMSSAVFILTRRAFNLRMKHAHTYDERDGIMALYSPVGLLALLPTWYLCALIGYAGMFWALGADNAYLALRDSGSSLLTLGFEPVNTLPTLILSMSEAILGLILVALLISYLPTMYSAFSRRETAVTLLEVRAGSPPSAVEMLKRYYRIQGLDELGAVWQNWETWFADIEESHTSLAALVFFRSPQPNHSWITAAGSVLDGASLTLSAVDIPHDPHADLCIRAGYLALRHIADFFQISYLPNPTAADPISICREEFDAVLLELERTGVPLKPDREKAWLDYRGWRVNYDTVLLALARITMAPEAPWISDKGRDQVIG